ncbi:uncharacterized protein LOC131846930 [Achroia grisella]|uniref:uncharacterized protein LOC131846930 n=1 Tax=Achroia grisella TaxID=688607 RepID=UPI0027D3383F|nr:uncharacterized protein LOC131846930 [Achroia grisella]
MILKKTLLSIILKTSCLQIVYGAAYSKVYVTRGAQEVPVEYLNYGAPPIITNPQLAQISAAPIGSVLPLQNVVSACVAPCIPSQPINTLATVPTSSKIIAYNSPNKPAVVGPVPDEKTSYEYSYVVYDENTGDQKAQRELSDGSVVEGEYSFIQPDGYVREVKYRADDLTGFNAVVKNFLPQSVPNTDGKKPEAKTKSVPNPACQETQKEALKVDQELITPTETPTPSTPELIPTSIRETAEAVTEIPLEPTAIVVVDPTTPETIIAKTAIELVSSPPKSLPVFIEIPTTDKTIEPQNYAVVELVNDSTTNGDPAVTEHDIINCTDVTHTHEAIKTIEVVSKPEVPLTNVPVAYNDIIRCVQAAIANAGSNVKPYISPLTYIILPGANKPC